MGKGFGSAKNGFPAGAFVGGRKSSIENHSSLLPMKCSYSSGTVIRMQHRL